MSIRVLPSNLVNQIAAGEVIERPASVIKELVENALDAGATRIEVTLKAGGKTLIVVEDNGKGMNNEDLAMAVERHATSKLPSDDLFNIQFLGFRGEALPSIASVSKMKISTRQADDDSGWELEIKGGEKGEIKPCAKPKGTRIEVRDLFYATPARLKFLKADSAEAGACADIISRIALANPDVSFYLYVDENLDVWHLGTQEERTRKATLLITYREGGQVEGTRTITVEQAKLQIVETAVRYKPVPIGNHIESPVVVPFKQCTRLHFPAQTVFPNCSHFLPHKVITRQSVFSIRMKPFRTNQFIRPLTFYPEHTQIFPRP